MAGCGLADREQALDVRLPPAVDAQTAVVVLGAECNFQRLGVEIHTLIAVEINRGLVHMRQPLNGCAEACPRTFQVLPRLRQQSVIGENAPHRVFAVVQVHLAAFTGLQVDKDINDGAAVSNLADVKRPLVALQEQLAQHIVGIGEEVHQELFFIAAVYCSRVNARQHLHIGTRHIPPRRNRCQAVLPFRQVFAPCARF